MIHPFAPLLDRSRSLEKALRYQTWPSLGPTHSQNLSVERSIHGYPSFDLWWTSHEQKYRFPSRAQQPSLHPPVLSLSWTLQGSRAWVLHSKQNPIETGFSQFWQSLFISNDVVASCLNKPRNIARHLAFYDFRQQISLGLVPAPKLSSVNQINSLPNDLLQ